jgi:hypothetical protein
MKIAEYRTANGDSFAALDKDVNKLLAQGYQLYGNPYFVENKIEGAIGTFMAGQAMVKYAMHEKFPPAEPLPAGSIIAP